MDSFKNYGVNRSMPSSTIIPVLAYTDITRAIDWLCLTFGFQERWRAGNHRAQLAIGDGAIALSQQDDMTSVPDTCSLMIRVNDVDSHYKNALAQGAKILHRPADFPYGERQYSAEDIEGYAWTFSQSIADVAPEDWGGVSSS